MRGLTIIGVVVALLAGVALAQAQDRAEIEAAIDALAARYVEGWNAGDAAACASIYAEDAESIDLAGESFKGRSAIEESIAATLEQFSGGSIQIERTSLHVVKDNLVVSDGTWEVTGSAAEGPTNGFYTIIAVQRDGEWLITSGQAKVPPPMQNQ